MRVVISNRLGPGAPVEELETGDTSATIAGFLAEHAGGKLNPEAFRGVGALADGLPVPFGSWGSFSLAGVSRLDLIVNPGQTGMLVATIIMAVASAALSFVMAAKVKTPNADTHSSSSSIYDPSAQGNKVHLEDPIPEQFGLVKAYPDLISDYHKYYLNNQRYLEVLLCQGVGWFDHSDPGTVYIGNTPLTDFDESVVSCKIYDPGQIIGAGDASGAAERKRRRCWYNSTEVTGSGHEISPDNGAAKETSGLELSPDFTEDNRLTVYKDVSGPVEDGGYDGPGWQTRYKAHNLNYKEGDIFRISGFEPLPDLVAAEETSATLGAVREVLVPAEGGMKLYSRFPVAAGDMAELVSREAVFSFRSYSRAGGQYPLEIPHAAASYSGRVTCGTDAKGEYYLIPVTADTSDPQLANGAAEMRLAFRECSCPATVWEEKASSAAELKAFDPEKPAELKLAGAATLGAGFLKPGSVVDIKAAAVLTAVTGYGDRGPELWRGTAESFLRTKVASLEAGLVTLEDGLTLPDASGAPAPAEGGAAELESLTLTVTIQTPFSYPNRDGNGHYRTDETEDFRMTVSAVDYEDFDHTPVPEWKGFPFRGHRACRFTLLTGANAAGGAEKVTTAGPYRACPIGAKSSLYEVDVDFPGGLYEMNDDGSYRERTARVKIEYREIGSADESWTAFRRNNEEDDPSFTYSTGDEIAETFVIDLAEQREKGVWKGGVPAALEFRLTNASEYTDSNRVQQKMVWNGLKAMIAAPESYPDVTVISLIVKGHETLSEANENRICTFWERKLPPYDAEAREGDAEPRPSRSIADAAAEICRRSRYGDLFSWRSWREFSEETRYAGLELNYRFDGETTILEALRDVLQVGYAEPVVAGNEIAPKRSRPDAPVTQLFTPSNMTGEPSVSYEFITEDTDTVTEITYMDGGEEGDGIEDATWKDTSVFVRVDPETNAREASDVEEWGGNVAAVKAMTLTNRNAAIRLAARKLRESLFCRTSVSFQTELDALNCQYGDLVLVALPQSVRNWFGRVLGYDAATMTATLDKKVNAADVNGVIWLRKPDGVPADCGCVPAGGNLVRLTDPQPWLGEWLAERRSSEELPLFAFGTVMKCRVTSIKPSGHKCSVECVNFDERIYADDPFFDGYGETPYGLSPYGGKEETNG